MFFIKWIRVRAAVKALKKAKINAYRRNKDSQSLKKPSRLKLCCKYCFCCCLQWKVYGTGTTAYDYLCTTGSYANKIAKGLFRFLLGLLSVALLLHFVKTKLNLSLSNFWLNLVGILVGLGVTFSQKFRVVLLLLAPQVFTQNVRFALMTNAAYVALKGPATNFRYNLDSLIDGLHTCKVDIENSLRDALDLILNPLKIIAEFFQTVESAIENALERLREAIDFVQDSVSFVEKAMHEAFDWLVDVTDMCNFQFGSPYHRCKQEFKEAVTDCNEKLGDALSFMCHVDVLDSLCEATKLAESMCTLPSIIGENVFSLIRIELEEVLDAWTQFFDARISNVTFVPPKSTVTFSKNVTLFNTLKHDIFRNIDWLLSWPITLQDILTLGIAIVMILSAVQYLYWYLHSEQHDNKYITDGMVKIDIRRRLHGKQGIFPLHYSEYKDYVQLWSFRKLKDEQQNFKRQILMVSISAIPTIIYVFIDLTLYSLLVLIDQLGEANDDITLTANPVSSENFNDTNDENENPLPKLSKRLKQLLEFDISDCTPIPNPPNFLLDIIIGIVLIFCILSTAFEAYGLRLRHVICGYYYPEKQLSRDRWLYTHILNSRGSFFKYAKTQIMAKLTGDDQVYRVGCVQRFINKCPGGRKLCWFFSVNEKQCFLCGKSGGIDNYDGFQDCPECKSVYCNECFYHLKRECPVCSNQIVYDLEIDEESGSTDSSDDERSQNSKPKKIMKMLKQIREQKMSDAASTRARYANLDSVSSYAYGSEEDDSTEDHEPADDNSTAYQEPFGDDNMEGPELLLKYNQRKNSSTRQNSTGNRWSMQRQSSSNMMPSKARQGLSSGENFESGKLSIVREKAPSNSNASNHGQKPNQTDIDRKITRDYHKSSLIDPRSFELEESDVSVYASPIDSNERESNHNSGNPSERSSSRSFTTTVDSHSSNNGNVNERLTNFWNFSVSDTGNMNRSILPIGSSELHSPWLTNREVAENVHSTYNSVLSDLSTSYKQFQIHSSQDLLSEIESNSKYDWAKSESTSTKQKRRNADQGHQVRIHHQYPLETSVARKTGDDYNYNSCIICEEDHEDDGLKRRYGQVLQELTSDFPQFKMQSESSESGVYSSAYNY